MTLADTQWYQGILASLTHLDRTVRLDPQAFADDNLKRIEQELARIVDAVDEGVI